VNSLAAEKKELAPGIFLYKNVNLFIDNEIDIIESLGLLEKTKWQESYAIVNGEKVVNKKIRDSNSFILKFIRDNDENLEIDSTSHEFSKKIFKATNPYLEDYQQHFGAILDNEHEDYRILKYTTGQKFGTHIDDGILYRRISTIYYLNDDYDGGEINFPRFNLSYKPKTKDFLIFPSNFMYSHYISEITKGTRYCIVNWKK
jgi:hypothetical protein